MENSINVKGLSAAAKAFDLAYSNAEAAQQARDGAEKAWMTSLAEAKAIKLASFDACPPEVRAEILGNMDLETWVQEEVREDLWVEQRREAKEAQEATAVAMARVWDLSTGFLRK